MRALSHSLQEDLTPPGTDPLADCEDTMNTYYKENNIYKYCLALFKADGILLNVAYGMNL